MKIAFDPIIQSLGISQQKEKSVFTRWIEMFIALWATAPDKSEPTYSLRAVRQERYLND